MREDDKKRMAKRIRGKKEKRGDRHSLRT